MKLGVTSYFHRLKQHQMCRRYISGRDESNMPETSQPRRPPASSHRGRRSHSLQHARNSTNLVLTREGLRCLARFAERAAIFDKAIGDRGTSRRHKMGGRIWGEKKNLGAWSRFRVGEEESFLNYAPHHRHGLMFHVKLAVCSSGSLRRVSSIRRFCKSLGDTPGILLAWPRVRGCSRCSRSRAS